MQLSSTLYTRVPAAATSVCFQDSLSPREEAPWPPVTPPLHTPPSASCLRLQQLLKMLNVINTFPIKCIVFSCSWILFCCFLSSRVLSHGGPSSPRCRVCLLYGERGLLFPAGAGLLITAASCCGACAQQLPHRGMWDPPRRDQTRPLCRQADSRPLLPPGTAACSRILNHI